MLFLTKLNEGVSRRVDVIPELCVKKIENTLYHVPDVTILSLGYQRQFLRHLIYSNLIHWWHQSIGIRVCRFGEVSGDAPFAWRWTRRKSSHICKVDSVVQAQQHRKHKNITSKEIHVQLRRVTRPLCRVLTIALHTIVSLPSVCFNLFSSVAHNHLFSSSNAACNGEHKTKSALQHAVSCTATHTPLWKHIVGSSIAPAIYPRAGTTPKRRRRRSSSAPFHCFNSWCHSVTAGLR